MFEEVKNDNFGLEWEPTHQMVQLIDPVTEPVSYTHLDVYKRQVYIQKPNPWECGFGFWGYFMCF